MHAWFLDLMNLHRRRAARSAIRRLGEGMVYGSVYIDWWGSRRYGLGGGESVVLGMVHVIVANDKVI